MGIISKLKSKPYPEDLKTKYGFSTMMWIHGFSTLVFALFMQYLTDYSGIDSAIGKVGFTASFGTVIILVSRIIDAVDDPLQAWIMDGAKESKFGKYRRFTFISIFLCGVGIILMFTLPQFVKSSVVLLVIWILFGYILYEIGFAFNGAYPLVQKITYDTNIRSSLTVLLRIGTVIAVVPASFFVPIVTFVNKGIGNMSKAFSLTVIVVSVIYCIISISGVMAIKEPYNPNFKDEEEEKLKLKEVVEMFKNNKPAWVHTVAYFLGNFAYAILTAVIVYFLKWYYCADLTTGVVDNDKYAQIFSVYTIVTGTPVFYTPFISTWFIKKVGSIDKAMRISTLIMGLGYLAIFIAYITGILAISPYIFIALCFIVAVPSGLAVVPAMLIWTECADYAEYTTGKNMTALVNSLNNLLSKGQAAIASLIPGLILMTVGYSVNADTGTYSGDLSQIPSMLTKLTVAISVIPAVVSIASWLIYKVFYPISVPFREKMTKELAERRKPQESLPLEESVTEE